MSETQPTLETPPAPDPAPSPAPAAPEWLSSLPEDLRAAPSLTRYKSVEELARGSIEREALIGRKGVPVPGENDPPEVRARFREAMGIPEKPEGYDLKLPDGVPGGVWNDQSTQQFRQWAHEEGLTPKQAQGIMNRYLQFASTGMQAEAQQREQAAAAAMADLQKEWGTAHAAKVEAARRAVQQFGGDELRAMLEETGFGNDPRMIRAMAAIGEQLAEDNPAGMGTTRSRAGALTPDEATAEVKRLMSPGQPYWNRKHPEYAAAKQRVDDLFAMGATF